MARSQDIINSITTTQIPSTAVQKFAYDGNNNVIYEGTAPRGTSVDTPDWVLIQFTYDGSNNCTDKKTAFDSWTNRVGASYA